MRTAVSLLIVTALAACGGGNLTSASSSSSAAPTSTRLSGTSTLGSSCGTLVPTGTGETFTSGSAVQPQVTAVPNANAVAVWEQDRWTGPGARGILSSRSGNGGAAWSAPVTLPFGVCGPGGNAAYDRVSDPWITSTTNGTLVASALAFAANNLLDNGTAGPSAVLVSRSTDGGATWSAPLTVFADANPAASTTLFFNDRDSVSADAAGNAYVAWDRLSSNSGITGSTPAYMAQITGNGQTLGNVGVLYDPGTTSEAFNNQIAVLPNGTVLDIFTLVPTTNLYTLEVLQVNGFSGGKWVTSTPGSTVANSSPAVIAQITVNSTFNPTPTGTPPIRDSWIMAQMAVDPASGAIAVVWQQAFGSNTTFNGIALSVSKDFGKTWSTTPKQINGAPSFAAFNPTVRYLPGSVLAVTYYDLRDYVSGSTTLSTDTWLTESSDGGTTWHEVRLQSPFDLSLAPLTDPINPFAIGTSALFLGDNQGLAAIGSNALPVYAATDSTGAHIYATTTPDPLTLSSAHVYTAF